MPSLPWSKSNRSHSSVETSSGHPSPVPSGPGSSKWPAACPMNREADPRSTRCQRDGREPIPTARPARPTPAAAAIFCAADPRRRLSASLPPAATAAVSAALDEPPTFLGHCARPADAPAASRRPATAPRLRTAASPGILPAAVLVRARARAQEARPPQPPRAYKSQGRGAFQVQERWATRISPQKRPARP